VQHSRRFTAALFDRDGTLLDNVPYNGDPQAVRPLPGAKAALDRLRSAGLRLGVVSNQSGIARGLLSREAVDRVNARVDELLGPFDTWQICPHGERDRCACRKPRPGMILAAAHALGVQPQQCVMVGDIGADIGAGLSAGAASVLVPTPDTLAPEIEDAPVVRADLAGAVDWILAEETVRPVGGRRPRVLAVRSDSAGDVLVTGPAIRALAEHASWLTLLCGPRGRAAAELLPGVDEVVQWCAPWIDPQPPAIARADIEVVVKQIEVGQHDEAVIFTSYHQSALPMALLLRMAGVPRISATSEDYPGALLDVRHRLDEGGTRPDLPEPERAVELARAAGFALPEWDDGRLRLRPDLPAYDLVASQASGGFIVMHPGASVPARACPPARCRDIVAALAAAGHPVLVTGGPAERELTAYVAGEHGIDVGGRTSLAELAALIADARALVVGNTGPAHLAAAVGTPVVSLFAPTVSYRRWGPYRVPAVRLGDPDAPCRDSRAARCPVPDHPCLSTVDPARVVAALDELEIACAS
jgi:histidinol-phosphate phosphatase family protein